MKVAAIRLPASFDSLTIEQRAEPAPGPGQVKVRWRALSLNFHDVVIAAGMLPTVEGRIPISDGAGEVVEVGAGVSSFKPADRVMSTFFPDWADGEPTARNTARLSGDSTDGCACEFGLADPATLTRMPKGWSFAEAATLPCAALTAWRALVDIAELRAGQSVLVQGSGGVSVFALQFAKALGARVYATSSTQAKCERLRSLGADATVNYKLEQSWGERVAQETDGGVDLVVDVGGPTTLNQSLDAARVGGRIVCVGLLGGMEASISVPKLLMKQQRIRPIAVGNHAHQRRMVGLIESSDIRPVIDRRFPFDQLADALRYQISGQHFGKIIVMLGTE